MAVTTRTDGFTIIELIIATVVMGLLGTALIRMMVSDSKFVSQIETSMAARQAARSAMTVISAELQSASQGAVTAATTKSVTIDRPVAFGMTCGTQGPWTHLSIMPTDSAMLTDAEVTGIAWRDSSGAYQNVTGITFSTNGGSVGQCSQDSIRVVSGGMVARARNAGLGSGLVFYLYETITYSFESSTSLTGRQGLFRTDGAATKEELLAPFDTSAGFGFLLGEGLVASDTVPGDLTTIRGLVLKLVGESFQNPQGKSEPAEFDLETAIPFRNFDE